MSRRVDFIEIVKRVLGHIKLVLVVFASYHTSTSWNLVFDWQETDHMLAVNFWRANRHGSIKHAIVDSVALIDCNTMASME